MSELKKSFEEKCKVDDAKYQKMEERLIRLEGKRSFFVANSNEIVIGGFRPKDSFVDQPSRIKVLEMINTCIKDAPGSPKILEERMGQAPTVVVVSFENDKFAEDFVIKIKGNAHKFYPGVWCNINRSE